MFKINQYLFLLLLLVNLSSRRNVIDPDKADNAQRPRPAVTRRFQFIPRTMSLLLYYYSASDEEHHNQFSRFIQIFYN
jgi:hypothetical protein